jgi:hypothetical protein
MTAPDRGATYGGGTTALGAAPRHVNEFRELQNASTGGNRLRTRVIGI